MLSTLLMAKLTLTVKLGVKTELEYRYLKQFVIEQYYYSKFKQPLRHIQPSYYQVEKRPANVQKSMCSSYCLHGEGETDGLTQ